MKPRVAYKELVGAHMSPEGLCAILFPVDHPNPDGLVSNKKYILTSPIVRLDRATQEIETANTIYYPMGVLQ